MLATVHRLLAAIRSWLRCPAPPLTPGSNARGSASAVPTPAILRPQRDPIVEDFLVNSAPTILSLRLVNTFATAFDSRLRSYRWSLRAAAITISIIPILTSFAVVILGLNVLQNDIAVRAFLYYLVLDMFCLWCPYRTWYSLIALGPKLDAMMPDRAERQDLVDWLSRKAKPRFWWPIYLLAGATATSTSIVWLAPRVRAHIPFTIGSHVAIFLTAMLGLENLLWVLRLPLLVRRVSQSSLELLWHYPAATPGLEGMSRLMGWTALLGIIGAAGFGVPVVYVYLVLRTPSVAVIAGIAAVFMVLAFMVTGFYPQLLI